MADLDRGLLPLNVAPVSVVEVLGRIALELAPRAATKDILWQLDVPSDLQLSTDHDKLERLIRALADNAVRYTTRGEVTVVVRPAAGGATLEVRDSGPGLDADLVVETEDVVAGRALSRPPRQLGFGLRLAGRLVRALGASLTIAPSPSGTTCHLFLPNLADTLPQAATA